MFSFHSSSVCFIDIQFSIYFFCFPLGLERERERGRERDVDRKDFLEQSGPEVIKLFSCSTQLSMKFFLLINVYKDL